MFERAAVVSFGSLVWKLFAAFAFIILATASVFLAAGYYVQQKTASEIGELAATFESQRNLATAAVLVEHGGFGALDDWIRTSDLGRQTTLYLLDEHARDVFGRTVPARAISSLVKLKEGPQPKGVHVDAVRRLTIAGKPYTLISVRSAPMPLIPGFIRHFPFGIFAASTIVFVLFVSAMLAWLYTRSLRRLDEAMTAFAKGDLSARARERIGAADAEVGQLAEIFDRMADDIASLIERQRRLFHDVSHEIRSPLARISVAVALAQRDPKRVEGGLSRIELEVGRIDKLIEDLLTYARFEENSSEANRLTVANPAVVLKEAAESLSFEAQSANVEVVCEAEDASARLNAAQLGQALDNVFRNALRHSPAGAAISIAGRVEGADYVITCRDRGPGIPADEIGTIFNPFVRGKDALTGTGFGLGLAIAKRALEHHGGRIEARNAEPGLEMRITLPIAHKHSV